MRLYSTDNTVKLQTLGDAKPRCANCALHFCRKTHVSYHKLNGYSLVIKHTQINQTFAFIFRYQTFSVKQPILKIIGHGMSHILKTLDLSGVLEMELTHILVLVAFATKYKIVNIKIILKASFFFNGQVSIWSYAILGYSFL